MEQKIVVLSYIPPKKKEDQWYFAALRLKEGLPPSYCLLSGDQTCEIPELESCLAGIGDMLQDATVFISDRTDLPELSRLLQFPPVLKDAISVRELQIVFFPRLVQTELPPNSCASSLQKGKTFRSPAHRQARMMWETVVCCWRKGMDADLGYLSRLQELAAGLSCAGFIEQLIKAFIKRYPDKPIRVDPLLAHEDEQEDDSLFPSGKKAQKNWLPPTPEWVEQCFQAGGLLSEHFPGYEPRVLQQEMAGAIISSFTAARHIVIEAGTGTGKSIAYLIPAIWWAKKNKVRVVVATNTINLQEQLWHKDLPFLKRVLPFAFQSALLKGKNNYVCLKILLQLRTFPELPEEKLLLAGLYSWVRETMNGEFAELPFLHHLSPSWRKYSAENPDCNPAECRFASRCFMLKARKKAENADLIVINHSLLFADIKTNHGILPEYGNLVVDEAHNLYAAALKHLGFEISQEQIKRLLENLAMIRGGLKRNLALWTEAFPSGNWQEFQRLLEEMVEQWQAVLSQAEELFALFQRILGPKLSLRISPDKLGEQIQSSVSVGIENLYFRIKTVYETLARLLTCLSLENNQLEESRYEIVKIKNELGELLDGLAVIAGGKEADRVTYLEKSNVLYLKSTAINIADILRRQILSKNCTAVFTSATLTVAGSFDYFAREIGLEDYESIRLDSPFDYSKQMVFCIAKGMAVHQTPEDVLAERTAYFLRQIGERMKGRTLVLFTSHRYLRLVYRFLEQELDSSSLRILAQGIHGSRDFLLQDFMRDDQSILLGTSSFWEGVDIPGDSLSCVIMTKLPFWAPDSPIVEAKAKWYESMERDPFRELYLPEAIIRFKQGFGRLIRSKEDKGMVILLDDRIINKQYGKEFLLSLPLKTHFRGSLDEIIQLVEKQGLMV